MRKARTLRRARRALAFGSAAFVAIQLALVAGIEGPLPALRDPEFAEKLDRLRARLDESRGRPLALLLGSSRTSNGVVPCRLFAGSTPGARDALVFNFAMNGSGPLDELLLLEQLLRQGIKPQRVLIEIHPAMLNLEHFGFGRDGRVPVERLDSAGLSVLRRYDPHPGHLSWRWFRSRLVPVHSHRFQIVNYVAPGWLDFTARQDSFRLTDSHGWFAAPYEPPSAQMRHHYTEQTLRAYAPAFQRFRVSKLADRALRDLLDLCRRERIIAAFFLMPEGTEFRAGYPPRVRTEVAAHLVGLHAEFGVPVYDATTWCDDDDFVDGHHLLREPAGRFSERFGREIVRPFLATAPTDPSAVARRPGSTVQPK